MKDNKQGVMKGNNVGWKEPAWAREVREGFLKRVIKQWEKAVML